MIWFLQHFIVKFFLLFIARILFVSLTVVFHRSNSQVCILCGICWSKVRLSFLTKCLLDEPLQSVSHVGRTGRRVLDSRHDLLLDGVDHKQQPICRRTHGSEQRHIHTGQPSVYIFTSQKTHLKSDKIHHDPTSGLGRTEIEFRGNKINLMRLVRDSLYYSTRTEVYVATYRTLCWVPTASPCLLHTAPSFLNDRLYRDNTTRQMVRNWETTCAALRSAS